MRVVQLLLLTIIQIISVHLAFAQTDYYSPRWSRVYRCEVKDLPKSALEIVDSIYNHAKGAENETQVIKALIYQSKFANTLKEDAEAEIISKFRQEIETAKAPYKHILHAMLANLYQDFYEKYNNRYDDRSNVEGDNFDDDLRNWDAKRFYKEIAYHFTEALRDEELLKSIPITRFDELITKAEYSDLYRPTLYDFIAHYAIDAYHSFHEELDGDRSIKYDSSVFTRLEESSLPGLDTISPHTQALILYKNLLQFHLKRRDTTAYVNTKIEQLDFVSEGSRSTAVVPYHWLALERLFRTYSRHPVTGLVGWKLAILYRSGAGAPLQVNPHANMPTTSLIDAVAICDSIIHRFPGTEGAVRCAALRDQIRKPELSATGEAFVPVRTFSRLLVEYTNVDSVTVDILRAGVATGELNRWSVTSYDSLLLRHPPIQTLSFDLPNFNDYEEHSTEVVLPPLDPGEYFLVVSVKSNNGPKVFDLHHATVSNITLIENQSLNVYRMQAVDRTNGKPIAGAQVVISFDKSQKTDLVITKKTSKDGYVQVVPTRDKIWRATVKVKTSDDSISISNYPSIRENRTRPPLGTAWLFTDRSIYRPGQIVYFKGVLVRKNGEEVSIVEGEKVKITITDNNNDVIDSLILKSNSYGSFSGEFTLPVNSITGYYRLRLDDDYDSGSRFYSECDLNFDGVSFSVEEYKRPTYQVNFEPVKKPVILGDTVAVKIRALAFNGSSVSGATVRYKVSRNRLFTGWDPKRRSYGDLYPGEQIVTGTGTTNATGEFEIKFLAISPNDEWLGAVPLAFDFKIEAEVTDINGETREEVSTVQVGSRPTKAIILFDPLLKISNSPIKAYVKFLTTNDEPASGKGTYKIYKLTSPHEVYRERPWSAPTAPMLNENEFKELFPFEEYQGFIPRKSKRVLSKSVAFNGSTQLTLPATTAWKPGRYLIEVSIANTTGDSTRTDFEFDLMNPETNKVADNKFLTISLDAEKYNVGDVARLSVGSAVDDIYVSIQIETDHLITKTIVAHISNEVKKFSIPVTESMRHGTAIHVSAAAFNSVKTETLLLSIATETKTPIIETISFRDKLEPGKNENWSFIIKNEDGPLQAELLASMYDMSLDQFSSHSWSFSPRPNLQYYSHGLSAPTNSTISFQVFSLDYISDETERHYNEFDWFGFSVQKYNPRYSNYMLRLYYQSRKNLKSSVSFRKTKRVPNGEIIGRVTATNGQPVQSVHVGIKGTTMGTVTDSLGYYRLKMQPGETLIFSHVGFAGAEARIGSKNTVNVILVEEPIELSELIITALGAPTHKAITGSAFTMVAPVIEEELEMNMDVGLFSVVETRQDRTVMSPRYRVRGASNREPVYIVDGVVVKGKFNLDEAADIKVLKPSDAAAIYGSAAADGAVIITTKTAQLRLSQQIANVKPRSNLKETAFFYPHLYSDENGAVKFSFTTPEALTKWKLQLLAHTRDLQVAGKVLTAITQKDLMVVPNAPRFLRVGDLLTFSAKVINLTSSTKEVSIGLELSDGITGARIEKQMDNTASVRKIVVNGNGNVEVTWKLKVPAGIDAVQYKLLAKAGSYSDGEQNILPVLPDKMLVNESLSMYARAGQTKTFTLRKLLNTESATRENYSLTLETTSNPVWQAIQSLPYLLEFPHECAEQLFSRYYANAIGSYLLSSTPKVRTVIEKWKASGSTKSNLEKNPELKSILINETPWVRDAVDEREQQQRIAYLLDAESMAQQQQNVIAKLMSMQLDNGGFPWFSGSGSASDYITAHIAVSYGHLRHLNIGLTPRLDTMMAHAVKFLDREFVTRHKIAEDAKRQHNNGNLSRNDVSNDIIFRLYARSYYPAVKNDQKVGEAITYFRNQAATYWATTSIYMKAMIALDQFRSGNKQLARDILRSLRENSIINEELGMYWKENITGFGWDESPIEIQSLMILAFSEIERDDQAVPDSVKTETLNQLRIWLLKNKQTNHWKTTKATTEAIYALLNPGSSLVASELNTSVSVGSNLVLQDNTDVEAATGYFKRVWKRDEITPNMGEVKVSKQGDGISWGALYWQYFEQLDNITSASSPLKVSKKLYVVQNSNGGDALKEISPTTSIKIGDKVRVRIEIRTDRDIDFVHMKDMRASGFEPINVISEYKWQGQLGYYQSTRDAATNFFFDRVSQGVHIIEYDLRANTKGDFSNGVTTIESMYAPEFRSNSAGIRVTID